MAALVCLIGAGAAHAQKADAIFTIANYPVEARGANAVAAKTQAIAEGQRAALRSLLRRLVPVTQYPRLRKIDVSRAADYVEGLRVRSERNSSTDYVANLDFSFDAQRVRELIKREGLTLVEARAPRVTLVPMWRGPEEGRGGIGWLEAFKSLDLEHTLTPVQLEAPRTTSADAIGDLASGNGPALAKLAVDYKADRVVAAIVQSDPQAKRVQVTLIGKDGVGPIQLNRTFRTDRNDPAYTIELAAVVTLGILEGRWKSAGESSGRGSGGKAGGAAQLQLSVEFRGMVEWQDISRRLSQTPGVEEVDVAGLSGRGARIVVRYGGIPEQLADAVEQQGLAMRRAGETWVLSAR